MHNGFMYVRYSGMRNTKTWSKSKEMIIREEYVVFICHSESVKQQNYISPPPG